MDTKKIEGGVDKTEFDHNGRLCLYARGINGDLPAILVIGEEGKPAPVVYTEKELDVKIVALLRDLERYPQKNVWEVARNHRNL